MSVCPGNDTRSVAVALCGGRRQPIMEAQSNICSIRTQSFFIHANTSILKKLNRVSAPSLTGGISRGIHHNLGYDSLGHRHHANWHADGVMGSDLYARGRLCHFFADSLQIMHNLRLESKKVVNHVRRAIPAWTLAVIGDAQRVFIRQTLMCVMDLCCEECTNSNSSSIRSFSP